LSTKIAGQQEQDDEYAAEQVAEDELQEREITGVGDRRRADDGEGRSFRGDDRESQSPPGNGPPGKKIVGGVALSTAAINAESGDREQISDDDGQVGGVDAHRAEFTCCTARNVGYFVDARVRYSSGMRCVLGFDGGGTKTDCVLMDETGAVLARTRSGPSNPILIGIAGSVAALVEGAEKALGSARLSPGDVRFVLGAVAGAAAARNLAQLVSQLEEKYVNAKVLIDSDAKLALGATGETPSVVVIAGTGSVVLGETASESAREGGLGAVFGDPGSAYDIGRRAVVGEQRRQLDGEDSLFRDCVLAEFGGDWDDFLEQARGNPIGTLPRVFRLVARAANEGDVAAQELLRNSAEELVVLVERVIKRLRLGWEDFLLARTGGVFGRSRYFDEAFDRGVRTAAPEARVGALPTPVAEYAAQVGLLMMRGMKEPGAERK
jgi:N-acetylglucosamine kinase-like BadF-type ATPase